MNHFIVVIYAIILLFDSLGFFDVLKIVLRNQCKNIADHLVQNWHFASLKLF